jgi:hypothetical protein
MHRRWLTGSLLLLLPACGDSGVDTVSASGSQTDTGLTSGGSDTPTGDPLVTTSDSGSASMSASGTTTAPTTTDPTVTTGPDSLSITGDTSATDTTAQATGDTTDTSTTTDTGVGMFCVAPEDTPEDVPLNKACDIPLQMGTFSPVIEWKYGTTSFFGPPVAGQTIDTNGSGQLDAQDKPLVFLYEAFGVTALWGDGSGVAWKKPGSYGNYGGLGLGDLDGDGWNEIVTAEITQVCALDGRDGAQKWCTQLPLANVDGFGFNYPAIADMDGDGLAEVVIGSAILDSTGGIIGLGKFGKGSANGSYASLSAIVDLDADGIQEVVTGNAAYDLDGNTLWANGAADGMVAVADFDLDGAGEIIKCTGTEIYGLESDGSVAWGPLQYPGANIGPPAIDDLDGDGTPEFVIGAQNLLIAVQWGGKIVWSAPISDLSGAAGPVLFDFEKDGYPEVLYADEVAIRFFSGLDGSPKFQSMSHKSGTALETPIVADVDGDNHVEIVLGHGSGNADIGAITVYGDADNTWPPGRKIWNQHTYSITNVSDLGGIPNKYQANWIPGFNSFRSGDAGQPPGEYHDLQVEILGVCEDQCEMGQFFMAARVRNAGNVEAPAGLPVTVRAGLGGPIVVTLDTTQPVPPGKTGEVLFFEFAANKLAQSQPVITVDDTGVGEGELFECDEQNNTAVWPTEVCPTVEPG